VTGAGWRRDEPLTPMAAVPAADRSWVTRVASSWPPRGSAGTGVADAAFTAAREWFLTAPPAAEFLHPVRVDRDGDVAVLVFRWRSDPRLFAVRVELPTRLEPLDDGWRTAVGWGVPDPGTGLVTSGPAGWADGLSGWLEEELSTGAMRGVTRRDGDLVVLDPRNRATGVTDRAYHLSAGSWGRVVDRAHRVDQESIPPAGLVRRAGFPTAQLVAAGRAGTLVSWTLAWVDSTPEDLLVGQAVCVATLAATPGSASLVGLDVAAAHCGRGLEERLLTEVLGDVADAGITTVDGVSAGLPTGSGWSIDPTGPGRVRLDV